MILEEFDFEKEAVINPMDVLGKQGKMILNIEIPKIAVACFSYKTFERMVEVFKGEKIFETTNANATWPVYKASYKGVEIALFMTDIGAAGVAGQIEEVYALGIETIIVFGTCGVLDKNIEDCSIIIPNMAVRDEGLSYHYLPASDEIEVNTEYIELFKSILDEVKYPYIVGKTWTTDAFYRETREKMAKRVAAGCLCVEMECSAMAAVARFREKGIFQFFHAADCLDGDKWDSRSLINGVKYDEQDVFSHFAMEMAVRVSSMPKR